ncbi:hypothetical protein Tco_0706385, partial [Tanacetum coccineum]
MVNTRQSTPEFSGLTFDEAVQRTVNALLPGLTTRLTNELRQNSVGSSGNQPPTIHTWLEMFGKQKPRSFSSATTPVDAEDWIAHIEKLFEVLGCADEFKAKLASYKFEGDALNWWKAFKQAKGGETRSMREYHTIRQREGETTGEFMKRFLRLAGFVGKKVGPPEEQAKHFKWALCDWILDGIMKTEFTDVAQVANAGRNNELLRERDGGVAVGGNMIRTVMTATIMTGKVAMVIRGHGEIEISRTEVGRTTVLLGLQVRRDIRTIPLLFHVRHVENFIRAGHVIGLLELATLVVLLSIWLGIVLRIAETVVKEMGMTSELLRKGVISIRLLTVRLVLQ